MAIARLTHLADGDLDNIRDYVDYVRRDNPVAANRVLDQLFETLESLADQPEMGEQRNDLAANLRAFVARPYVIF